MTTQAFLLEDVMRGLDRGINMAALWAAAADKPVQKCNMSAVRHWVYSPCWSTADDCFLSPYQVLMQPKRFPEHMARIKTADLTYPLIVVEDDFDSHRFAKMILEKRRVVRFVYFTKKEIRRLQ